MSDGLPPGCGVLGDVGIFAHSKTAFLCSRKIPAATVLKVYEWAQQMRSERRCVISGFHATLENDVWDIVRGGSPLVWVCARGIPKKPTIERRRAIDNGEMLVISPFDERQNRPTKHIAHLRNIFVLQHAEDAVIGHANEGGRLSAAIAESEVTVRYLG